MHPSVPRLSQTSPPRFCTTPQSQLGQGVILGVSEPLLEKGLIASRAEVWAAVMVRDWDEHLPFPDTLEKHLPPGA